MLKDKYKSSLLESIHKKNVFLGITIVVIISNLLLSIKIFNIETDEKTIVHPVNLLSEYTIEGDKTDPNYMSSLAEDFLRARFLYNPKTVSSQFDNISRYFHPSIYGEKKAELDAEAKRIIRNDETSVFFPMSTHVAQMDVYIEAEITGYIGKKAVTEDLKYFEVSFRNSGGRIWLYNWQEVKPDSKGKKYTPVDSEE